ncbi:MAG: aspartate/glutamate racemase family protein [Gammaproteobacteria bacterium]|nr:aspartate/glutamate racemase family protein [Gammaproteobacteria bacterium]
MQIGLIGGIGPAATDYYYRRLISEFASRKAALEMTIVHADTPTLLHNLECNDIDAQVEIYNRLTDRLVSAGAECVVVTSIAGHFCIDIFKENSPLHVIDMLTEVNEAIKARELARIGILGTRTVMETRFYSGISTAEVIPPIGSALDDVHSAYVSMAASGYVTSSQRAVFDFAFEWLVREANVDAIMLGGTDLALVYKEGETQFPVVDCAAIHVDAVVRHATS